MKRGITFPHTQIKVIQDGRKGESIEEMLRRVRNSKEPIKADAKVSYTERKDGVVPMYDIRTDRFEFAMNAADRVHATKYAQRMAEDGFEKNEQGKWVAKATGEEVTTEA